MSLNAVKMLGISVTISPKDKILEYLEKGLEKRLAFRSQLSAKQKKTLVVVTPNPEQIVLAQEDTHFAKILNRADVALPDGIGLAIASRFLSYHVSPIPYHETIRRIPGVEFMDDLAGLAAKRGYPIALIGGRAGVAVSVLECLRRKYPGLTGWAMEPGELPILPITNTTPAKRDPQCCISDKDRKQHRDNTTNNKYDQYFQDIIRKIRKTRTRIIFVGLGAPKQEYFIEAISDLPRGSGQVPRNSGQELSEKSGQPEEKKLKAESWKLKAPLILMSVGGSFDIISGRTPRAPSFVRAIGLEWFWRLVHEPWRWKRQLVLVKFLWLVIREKLASKG